MVKKTYTASDIEILKGIEPVQKRPGMYTDTSTPNHLLQEVIDNCVDESIAGFCNNIDITVNKDGSFTVKDDGRGMPVDIHPEYKKSGVEVIMTNLHSGAKFSNKNYKYSGGLHGVGVSVVSALSETLTVNVERADDPDVYDMNRLHKLLEAKSILKPGLKIKIFDLKYRKEEKVYCHSGSLDTYLKNSLKDIDILPKQPIFVELDTDQFELTSTLCWHQDSNETIQDSYVNLIPTSDGGTHVNSLKSAVTDSIREFMTSHKLTPKNTKIIPDDIWKNTSYLLSAKR